MKEPTENLPYGYLDARVPLTNVDLNLPNNL